MAVVAKAGARFGSVVCETQVVVVKWPGGDLDLRCGGHPMEELPGSEAAAGQPIAPFDEGTQVGKRYTNEDESLELLCTRGGAGSVSVGDEALTIKGAKPLPASD
jgi:hypothetical protein